VHQLTDMNKASQFYADFYDTSAALKTAPAIHVAAISPQAAF